MTPFFLILEWQRQSATQVDMLTNVTKIILQAFKEDSLVDGDSYKGQEIKLRIKSKLSADEIHKFTWHLRTFHFGLFTWTEERRIVSSITLSRKGFEHIYRYDALNVEEQIINHIVLAFRTFHRSKKNPTPDAVHLQVIIDSIKQILNPKMKEDRCFANSLKVLIEEGLIIRKGMNLVLTEQGMKLMYET